jgi:endonuclease/exonuclease/phosphatase family metal-dependent hydrolase
MKFPAGGVRFYVFLLVCVMSIGASLAQYPSHVKFLTYNLWGYHNAATPGGYEALADVINEIDPDISGHQEVDSANSRSNGVDVIGYLGELTGMYTVYAPALKNWNQGHYGEGLLADLEPLSERLFWVEEPGGEDRSAIEIEITMAGEKVRVLTTHLAHENDAFAAHQAEEMVKWIDSGGTSDIPMIIMGDFNSVPGDIAMVHYENAGFVYVRDENGNVMDNIDHIMYRPPERWNMVEAGKPTHYTASDHDPVWAIMELLNPKTITLKSPDGGEEWEAGRQQDISWSFTGDIGDIKLEYHDGSGWIEIAGPVPAADSVYSWTVPDDPADNVRIRISEVNGYMEDESNESFAIIQPVSVRPHETLNRPVAKSGRYTVLRGYLRLPGTLEIRDVSGRLVK